MLKYLGNQYIPYINMGSNASASFVLTTKAADDPYLRIDCMKEYDVTIVSDAINNYRAAGWEVIGSGTGFKATKKDQNLEVQLLNDGGFLSVNIYYDEPYNPDAVKTWSSDLDELFTTHLGKHEIPYIYLGTANPNFEWNTSNSYAYIYGRGYDDDMVDRAIQTLGALDEWTVNEGDVTYGQKSLTAVGTMSDGCQITLELENMNATNKRARLKVSYREAFDASNFQQWTSDITSIFNIYMEGHALPVIYLGSDNPEGSFAEKTNKLTITGGFWNEQVLALAKTALENDADDAGKCYWTIEYGADSYGKTLNAKRVDFDDGCALSLVVSKSSNADTAKCKLVASYIPKIEIPSTATGWNLAVQDKLKSKFNDESKTAVLDDHELPYIYLNTEDETATLYSTSFRYMIIKGGTYNPNVVINAIKTYEDAGWTVTKTETSGNPGFTATKSFHHDTTAEDGTVTKDGDIEHDCQISVKLAGSSSYQSAMSFYVYYNEGFGLYDYTAYDSGFKSQLKTNFNNFSLPVFYLGSSWIKYTYSSTTDVETIYGGAWNDSLWTSVKTTLENDGDWTITDKVDADSTPTLKATKADGENGTVSLEFSKYSSSAYAFAIPMMKLSYKANFNAPENGTWSSATQTIFDTNIGEDKTIPYTYLHVAQDGEKAGKWSSTTNSVTITGGTWDTKVMSLAETTYKAAGWDVSYGYGSYSRQFQAKKKFDDGSYIRIKIYASSNSSTAKTSMVVCYDAPVTIDSSTVPTAWDDAIVTKMKTVLGDDNVIPYLYMGGGTLTATVTSNTNCPYLALKYTKGALSGQYLYNAEKTLKDDGWTVEMDYFYTNIAPKLTAYKVTSKEKLNLVIKATSKTVFRIDVYYTDDISKAVPEDYEFSSTYLNEIKDLYGIDMPSIYLGLSDPSKTVSYTAKTMTLKGKGYSPTLISDAKSIFEADKKNTWTTSTVPSGKFAGTYVSNDQYNSYSYYYAPEGEVLQASTVNSSGKNVVVYLYQYQVTSSTSYDYFYSYPQMEFYLS